MLNNARIAYLIEDATPFKDSVQLRYRRRGASAGVFSGPPASICPPIDELKAGVRIRITFDYPWGSRILKVELAPRAKQRSEGER